MSASDERPHREVMNIHPTSGIGHRSTQHSALATARYDAGIPNDNLPRLNVVIAPTLVITIADPANLCPQGDCGDGPYVGRAKFRTSTPDEEGWAGVGWPVDEGSGRGLVVEFDGSSEEFVPESIDESSRDLTKTRGVEFAEITTSFAVQRVMTRRTVETIRPESRRNRHE